MTGGPSQLGSISGPIIVTNDYVVIILSSIAYNPCVMHSNTTQSEGIVSLGGRGLMWRDNLPARVLIYDKRRMTFVTKFPINLNR